jgi:VWFA-related protein
VKALTRVACVVAVAAGVLALDIGTRAQQAVTFRSGVEIVCVTVSVRAGNQPVADLTPADFTIDDNGVKQEITDFDHDTLPLDITLALDASVSVQGALLKELQAAVRSLMASLKPVDRIKLIGFNRQIARLVDFTSNARDVDEAMTRIALGGGTSITDVIAVALVAPQQPDRRHLLVLLTDGYDNSSTSSETALLELTDHIDTAIDAVIVHAPQAGSVLVSSAMTGRLSMAGAQASPPVPHRDFFTQLTEQTAGLLLPVDAGASVKDTFQRALDDFRTSYVLGFTPKGVPKGGAHQLSVRVTRPGKFEIRARKSYSGG